MVLLIREIVELMRDPEEGDQRESAAGISGLKEELNKCQLCYMLSALKGELCKKASSMGSRNLTKDTRTKQTGSGLLWSHLNDILPLSPLT